MKKAICHTRRFKRYTEKLGYAGYIGLFTAILGHPGLDMGTF